MTGRRFLASVRRVEHQAVGPAPSFRSVVGFLWRGRWVSGCIDCEAGCGSLSDFCINVGNRWYAGFLDGFEGLLVEGHIFGIVDSQEGTEFRCMVRN